jgi:hypothetical protein
MLQLCKEILKASRQLALGRAVVSSPSMNESLGIMSYPSFVTSHILFYYPFWENVAPYTAY